MKILGMMLIVIPFLVVFYVMEIIVSWKGILEIIISMGIASVLIFMLFKGLELVFED